MEGDRGSVGLTLSFDVLGCDVTSAVHHARDHNARFFDAVEGEKIPDGKVPCTGQEVVTRGTGEGHQGKLLKSGINVVKQPVGCRRTVMRDI